VGAMFNADPHPGNYVFQEGGAITFLDFGCCQTIPEPKLSRAREIHLHALAGDEAAFRDGVTRMVGAKPGALERRAQDYTLTCFAPLFQSPYRITRSYAASLVEEMREMAGVAKRSTDEEFFTMPPDMFFMNRLQFGFYSVLARLDVEANYREVERRFLG